MFFFEYILESNLKKKHRGVLKRICPSKISTVSGGSRFNRALLIHRYVKVDDATPVDE